MLKKPRTLLSASFARYFFYLMAILLAPGFATDASAQGYEIHFWEDFDDYPDGPLHPSSNWDDLNTPGPTINPQIISQPPGSQYKLLRFHLDENVPSVTGIISDADLQVEPTPFFATAGSGIGPSGYLERRRWAVISDFRLQDLDGSLPAPGEHMLTAMRVRLIGTTDQTRFGLSLQPKKGRNGNCQGDKDLAFMQLTNPTGGGTIAQCFRLKDRVVPANNDSDGDYRFRFDGSVRYVVTFEEWEQREWLGWRRWWEGTVYRFDAGGTLIKLGSKKLKSKSIYDNDSVCGTDEQSGQYKCVDVPSLSWSRIFLAEGFKQMDVDVNIFYAAYYQY